MRTAHAVQTMCWHWYTQLAKSQLQVLAHMACSHKRSNACPNNKYTCLLVDYLFEAMQADSQCKECFLYSGNPLDGVKLTDLDEPK